MPDLLLARGLAVMFALCLIGVGASPFFYGWHVVAAWVFLAVVLAALAISEDRAAQTHRRRMRRLTLKQTQVSRTIAEARHMSFDQAAKAISRTLNHA